ncbi:MAG: hypothetical protein K6E30_05105 [Lachnospiraceae bacterium]|nr:hypothetical protein [Lachnospiraceae bacterium]
MSRVHSIGELKQKCAEKNMPLEKMRFFIGEDRKEPRCFGVYQDPESGDWIVYKNKDNGERAVRYQGKDEARAAQEIWAKIGAETVRRKRYKSNPYDEEELTRDLSGSGRKPFAFKLPEWLDWQTAGFAVCMIATAFFIWQDIKPSSARSNGYYQVGEALFYSLDDDWYYYDSGDWSRYSDTLALEDDSYLGNYYSFEDPYDAFSYTEYYQEAYEYDGDDWQADEYDDDDYDYDYDDWDAGDTDWGSDW